MTIDRHFDKEIKFRATKEQTKKIQAAAKAKGMNVSDFLRHALREYLAIDEMKGKRDAIQSFVANAVEEKLRPVENRLAKITAKTAHATAISIFLQAQAMADLGKSDVVEIFQIARKKGLTFVRDKGIPTTGMIEEELEEIEGEQ